FPCTVNSYLLASFSAPSPTVIYTLSLHDALPILARNQRIGTRSNRITPITTDIVHSFALMEIGLDGCPRALRGIVSSVTPTQMRSEEHTSELQSRFDLVCRLLLEKKNANTLYLLG